MSVALYDSKANISRYLQNLNISVTNPAISVTNAENVQIGDNNCLVVVRGIEEDTPENNNNISLSEVTLKSGDDRKLTYRTSGPTSISFGNNCTIAEIILNKEVVKDLLKNRQFSVTKGDNLLSVTWYDNQSQSEQVQTDHQSFKIRFIEDQNTTDTSELEKQVFKLLADCKDTKLVQLVTELVNIHKARLKHINMGCIELEFDLSDGADNFQDKKEEIKDLLRRTIIPEGAVFDIELKLSPLRTNEGLSTPESFKYHDKGDVMTDDKDLALESNKECSSVVAGASSPHDEATILISGDGELELQKLTTPDTKPVETINPSNTESSSVVTGISLPIVYDPTEEADKRYFDSSFTDFAWPTGKKVTVEKTIVPIEPPYDKKTVDLRKERRFKRKDTLLDLKKKLGKKFKKS